MLLSAGRDNWKRSCQLSGPTIDSLLIRLVRLIVSNSVRSSTKDFLCSFFLLWHGGAGLSSGMDVEEPQFDPDQVVFLPLYSLGMDVEDQSLYSMMIVD